MLKILRKRTGQSTIEYIVLVTGVIALLIIFLQPNTGIFSRSLNRTLVYGTNGMEDMANRLAKSRYDQPATPAEAPEPVSPRAGG